MPPVGGDTVWASTTTAYSQLDESTQQQLTKNNRCSLRKRFYSPAQQNLHSQLSNMNIETSETANETQATSSGM